MVNNYGYFNNVDTQCIDAGEFTGTIYLTEENAVARRRPVKRVFLKISQNRQENICTGPQHRCFTMNLA